MKSLWDFCYKMFLEWHPVGDLSWKNGNLSLFSKFYFPIFKIYLEAGNFRPVLAVFCLPCSAFRVLSPVCCLPCFLSRVLSPVFCLPCANSPRGTRAHVFFKWLLRFQFNRLFKAYHAGWSRETNWLDLINKAFCLTRLLLYMTLLRLTQFPMRLDQVSFHVGISLYILMTIPPGTFENRALQVHANSQMVI
jgi:hypothetical protein